MPRIVLVVSSPRFPLLFPPQTWRALDAARPVYLLDAEHPSLPALDVGEIPWEVLTPAADSGPAGRDLLLVGQGLDLEGVAEARRRADALLDAAKRDGSATLLLPPRNDGPLVQLVADRAARQHIEVETVYPLGEPKGSALLDLVATEARLRGPDGCPWDREQTHASLARHLVEESYELLDAIEEGDPDHLREELEEVLAADEPEQLEWEVGDLLFAAVALARAVGVEPEAALRRTSRRFRARYAAARAAAEADGHDPSSLELEQWIAYWKAAKRALAEAEEAATGTES